MRDPQLPEPLVRAVDAEGRLPAALEALGPVTGRDVAVLDATDGPGPRRLLALGAWVRTASAGALGGLPDASADVLVAWRTGFFPADAGWHDDLAQAGRVLRAAGRLLVVKDYGRDEVTPLFGDEVRARELVGYSHPKGPFLGSGFRVRVLHCWWRWETQEEAATELDAWFGEAGRAAAQGMRRPRLSYKVAVYHADASQLAAMAA
ncbi:MAG: hypothetical protein ABWZ82_01130 [Candidatus Limnocylindrales bacterium]